MAAGSRRFYQRVTVVARGDGFLVALDDRPAKTPAKAMLNLPTEELAAAIADEWHAQGACIDPHTMPLTRLAATALDRVSGQRQAVIDGISAYAASELLCYRADAPDELVARQHRAWQPLLDWAADRWGATLQVTRGVVPIVQPASALHALRGAVAAFADFPLTGLASAVQTTGSLIVGLALAQARIDAEAAYQVALLDECFQAERWGCDAEAEQRRQRLADEIRAARRFIDLVGSENRSGSAMSEMNQASKVVRVRIEGRVQGVWYRGWAVHEAVQRGLRGWVRNRSDGSVEALFAGSAPAVDSMLEACWRGPPAARVARVTATADAEPEAPGFDALPTL